MEVYTHASFPLPKLAIDGCGHALNQLLINQLILTPAPPICRPVNETAKRVQFHQCVLEKSNGAASMDEQR